MEEGTDCCLLQGTFADLLTKLQYTTTNAFGHQRGRPVMLQPASLALHLHKGWS